MDDLHQLFGSLDAGIGFGQVRIDQMLADMILKNFGNKAFQGSAARGGLLKDPCAFLVALNRALDCLNLPFNALEAVQQFRPVSFHMSHW